MPDLNILLLTFDDMNYDSPGCYGNPMEGITPNLDKLAAEGMVFEHSHVTIGVCQPSRSAILTGLFPNHNGARGFEDIDESVTTLTQVLHDNGYYNGIIGKEDHVAPRRKFFWDEYVAVYNEENGWGRDPEVYYEKSFEFFRNAKDSGRPFFAMINSHDPHRPFAGADDEIRYFGHHTTAPKMYSPDEVYVPGHLPDLPDIRKELAQYYSSVHRGDATIGRILDALEENGYKRNTLVLFLSDNGMAFPFAKTNCYQNSTRSPYILRWPERIKGGQVCHALISGVDFAPTILDILGLRQISGFDGKSFKNAILVGQEVNEDIFTMFFKTANNAVTKMARSYPMRCVQNKRFAYIFNDWSDGRNVFMNESTEGLTFSAMQEAAKEDDYIKDRVHLFQYRVVEEFYDVEQDPNALVNLIDAVEYRDIIQHFRQRMKENLEAAKDPLLDSFIQKVLLREHIAECKKE